MVSDASFLLRAAPGNYSSAALWRLSTEPFPIVTEQNTNPLTVRNADAIVPVHKTTWIIYAEYNETCW